MNSATIRSIRMMPPGVQKAVLLHHRIVKNSKKQVVSAFFHEILDHRKMVREIGMLESAKLADAKDALAIAEKVEKKDAAIIAADWSRHSEKVSSKHIGVRRFFLAAYSGFCIAAGGCIFTASQGGLDALGKWDAAALVILGGLSAALYRALHKYDVVFEEVRKIQERLFLAAASGQRKESKPTA